ncbi:uroporphyrinogen-III synthase [Mesobacillus foraminis]|uniref:uroporphyrinogen-III synthase n=1 Tax=Mesobacillus foraminis TaxID=279826 RepID=UPI0039A1DC7C
MGRALAGKHIALGASRKIEEMSTLIKKQGGTPVVHSLQGTVILSVSKLEPDLIKLVREVPDWVIFTTGIGLDTLLDTAMNLGKKDELINRMKEARIASRGYKTLLTLKKLGFFPDAVDEDGTTGSLIKRLDRFDLSGKKVFVQLHGETAPTLVKFLEDKGASVYLILPYVHIPPEEESVSAMCTKIIGKYLDAVCFTTAIQVRSLFDFARKKECLPSLLSAFKGNTLAVAVGKVTAEALAEEGVDRIIVPEHERMGAMVIELSRYYSKK